MKFLLFLVLVAFVFSAPIHAQVATFSVTPKVCVVSQKKEFCDLELQFNWQIDSLSDVCLYKHYERLFCWQKQRSGQFNYKARVHDKTIYSLIDSKSGVLLAKTQVEVQSANSKKTRLRLRSPWSFFN